mmetsp:Transcript_3788/g.9053  ORF Transcript_3788/g.9053 Transcript_3788/m.9053 type:complete len:328 (-) Transcript_3788:146-1129(-)
MSCKVGGWQDREAVGCEEQELAQAEVSVGGTLRQLRSAWYSAPQMHLRRQRGGGGETSVGVLSEHTQGDGRLRGEAMPDTRAEKADANSLSPKHPLIGAFMADNSHAMYKPDQEDQNKVRAYLTKTGTDPTTFPKSYFHRHPCIRRYLKQPGELVAALDIVWHQWQSATSRHILKQGDIFTEGDGGTAVEHAKFRALAKGGWLSDPAATAEVFPIHIAVGDPLPKSGLQRYRSLRGTSHLEGYHSHLHKATRDAPNHGPTLAAALLGDLNHRFSIDSASKNVRGEMYYDCYTPWILDQINVIYEVYKQPIPYPGVFVNKIGPTSPSS